MVENSKIFFHAAEQFVRDEIKNREVQYGAAKRAGFHSKEKHASFIHGKTAWATVKAGDKVLENSKEDLFESYYQQEGNGNYVPRAGLIDVNIRHDGDYGTLQRATVNFKTFTIGQLEDLECAFLSVGNDVTVEYGWSVGGRSDKDNGANSGKFVGVINNFSYTLNKEGGFDCTFDAVGEGYFTLGTDPTAMGGQAEIVISEDESGIPDTPYTGIIKLIRSEIKDGELSNHGDTNGNIAAFNVNLVMSTANPEESNGSSSTTPIKYYTTLEHLVETINAEILRTTKSTNKFICNAETTVGYVDPWIKSPATQHIVYPSVNQGNYEPKVLGELGKSIPTNVREKLKTNLTTAASKEKFKPKDQVKLDFSCGGKIKFEKEGTDIVDLSKILINLDTLQTIKTSLVKDKDTSTNVKNLLSSLFDLIRTCSGNAYDLTIVPDPENPKDMLIVNGRYTSDKEIKEDQWVVFKPFTVRSVVRDVSLSGQIPDELAAVAYVAGKGGDANTNQYPEHVAKMLSGGQCDGNNKKNATDADVPGSGVLKNEPTNAAYATSNAPLDPNVNKQIQDQQKAKEAQDIKTTELANLYTPLFLCFLLGPRQDIDFEANRDSIIYTSAQNIGLTVFPAIITRSAEPKTKWNANVAIPLQFGVTIDGINGFKFGDIVSTTYMPSKYKGKNGFKAAFTITKVNHTISNNDWTTELETVCRLV